MQRVSEMLSCAHEDGCNTINARQFCSFQSIPDQQSFSTKSEKLSTNQNAAKSEFTYNALVRNDCFYLRGKKPNCCDKLIK